MRCTRCRSKSWSSSRLKIWEAPLRVLGMRPMRCGGCGRRDYRGPIDVQVSVRVKIPKFLLPGPARAGRRRLFSKIARRLAFFSSTTEYYTRSAFGRLQRAFTPGRPRAIAVRRPRQPASARQELLRDRAIAIRETILATNNRSRTNQPEDAVGVDS